MTDNTGRFEGKGEIYAKARPKYAEELFACLAEEAGARPGAVFADVGSGTGIFTEQLLERGYRVYGVEPNGDMRKKAEEKLDGREGFVSVDGCDRDTGLREKSVDFVSAAQAFHWFDGEAFRRECTRILRPGGKVCIIYNHRPDDAPTTRALYDLRKKYSPQFHGFSDGMTEDKIFAFFGGEVLVRKWPNPLVYTREEYVRRALSSSYSVKEDSPLYGEYLADLDALFDRFAGDGAPEGRIRLPNETVLYAGEIAWK